MNFVKDNYLHRRTFEEQKQALKDEYTKFYKENEDGLKKLNLRIID